MSTSGDLHEVSVAIGKLQSTTDALTKELAASKQSRGKLYEAVEELTTEVKIISSQMKEVLPKVQEFDRWKERAYGAVIVLALLASSIGMAAGWIVNWFTKHF